MTDNMKIGLISAGLWLLVGLCFLAGYPAKADEPLPKLNCFIGASAGTAAMASKVDSVVRIDVGGTAPLLSGEVGCKVPVGAMSAMAILRADLQRLSGSAEGATLTSNARYMGILAASVNINPSMDVYVGPALVMSRFSIKDWQSTNVTGYGAVAGLEFDVGKGPFKAFAEYNWIGFRSYDASGATVKPSESVARVGLRMGF